MIHFIRNSNRFRDLSKHVKIDLNGYTNFTHTYVYFFFFRKLHLKRVKLQHICFSVWSAVGAR